MGLVDEFVAVFGVWEEARTHLALMVEEPEMRLIVAMRGQALSVEEAARLMDMSHDQAASWLHRCYARCILNKTVDNGRVRFTPADFGARLDHFAKYEKWDDIPAPDRQAIDRRFLDEFIAKHLPSVELKKQGLSAENALPNDTVMLLSEIEEMLDAARHIVVQPCDCRRLGQNCARLIETCIWLDEGALAALDRGHGRRLTQQQAKELVRRADQKGLMHTADSEWRTRGLHAICNCCACDCYPFRAAQKLGSKYIWPRSRYVAVHRRDVCSLCGACVKRCHFAAFYHDGSKVKVNGKTRKDVQFDPSRCWGCGLCANTCPTQAIVMEPLGDKIQPCST